MNVWPLQPEDLVAEACTRLTRDLTEEEWQEYLGETPYSRSCETPATKRPSSTASFFGKRLLASSKTSTSMEASIRDRWRGRASAYPYRAPMHTGKPLVRATRPRTG